MDFETKSHVYILVDNDSRVTQIEGEYSLSNIPDMSKAILVEEGAPCDRLNHAQNYYLPKTLYTESGLCRYKWTGTEIVERTTEEIEDDSEPEPAPTQIDRIEAQVTYTAMMTDTMMEG